MRPFTHLRWRASEVALTINPTRQWCDSLGHKYNATCSACGAVKDFKYNFSRKNDVRCGFKFPENYLCEHCGYSLAGFRRKMELPADKQTGNLWLCWLITKKKIHPKQFRKNKYGNSPREWLIKKRDDKVNERAKWASRRSNNRYAKKHIRVWKKCGCSQNEIKFMLKLLGFQKDPSMRKEYFMEWDKQRFDYAGTSAFQDQCWKRKIRRLLKFGLVIVVSNSSWSYTLSVNYWAALRKALNQERVMKYDSRRLHWMKSRGFIDDEWPPDLYPWLRKKKELA